MFRRMKPELSPQDWRQIEQLFHAALSQPADTRRAWLDQALVGQPHLRAELEALLLSDAQDTDISGQVEAQTQLWQGTELAAGERLGPWCILKKLDAGGMSTVYQAQRAEGAFE